MERNNLLCKKEVKKANLALKAKHVQVEESSDEEEGDDDNKKLTRTGVPHVVK